MAKDNVLVNKSYVFALRIINLFIYLKNKKKENVIAKQVLRSGTSIGANIEEAVAGQSDKDFIAKLSISYKEAKETHYWLRLLKDSGFIDEKQFKSIIKDCEEIIRLLVSILKTSKSKLQKT
jgi:four helix bundle protein